MKLVFEDKKRMNEELTSQNNWTIFAEEENSSWSEDTVKQFVYSLHSDSNEMIKKVSCTEYNIIIYLNDGEDIKSMSDFYRDVFTRGGLKAKVDFDIRSNSIFIELPTKELNIIAYIDYLNKLYNILDNYELKLDLYKALTYGHWD